MASYAERHASLRPLTFRDYRLLLAGASLVSLVMPFQYLSQVFWVQAEYPGRAVLYTSLITASRGLAMLLFSLVGGAVADRVERRKVLLVTESASLGINAVVAGMMLAMPFGGATVGAVIVCTFFAAGVMSVDGPARSASMPAVVGMENLASAISLNMVVTQLTLPLSLSLVGILSDAFSPSQVYAGSLIVWTGILPAIALLRYQSSGRAGASGGMFANIRSGLRYARGSAIISGVLTIVLIVQLVGMPVATPLGPVFMIEVLKFTSAQVGFMGMTWGLGALSASFFFARMQKFALRGATLALVAIGFGAAVVGFGASRQVILTALFDFAFGFGFTATMLTASTLVQHTVDDAVRGRVLGLFPFVGGLANLCTAPIGVAGQKLGLALMVPALGLATVVLCSAAVAWRPEIVSVRVGRLRAPESASSAPVPG